MFGIVFMGILTSCTQFCVELVREFFEAVFSLGGLITGSCLGCAQGFEYVCSLGVEACVIFMRALTCGLL